MTLKGYLMSQEADFKRNTLAYITDMDGDKVSPFMWLSEMEEKVFLDIYGDESIETIDCMDCVQIVLKGKSHADAID